ncbi:MAG: ABC transporter ATP-binding protein [Planctomycetota bacterium]|nr:ABC transporter ATP-binding protein [Planctomycetota bacterium]
MSDAAVLSVRDLRKVYKKPFEKGGIAALDGVSLEVGRGTIFGLLGPNGAGKTTLVKVLLGLVRGHTGEARLFGLEPLDPRSRERVGYLPEAHRLPGHLTGRQLLRLFGRLSGRAPADVDSRVGALLERVGMEKAADRKVREYSKGMQQRIGLAQALVHSPDLVFLDEPTDGVDPVGRAQIRELVLELKRSGVTLFLNSHLLLEVELMCDRVVIMDKGRILREGTIADLTPATGVVRFEIGAPRADLDRVLAGVGANLRVDGATFQLAIGPAELDSAIDRLRAAGVSIRAVEPRRLNLEEAFLDLVRASNSGSPR